MDLSFMAIFISGLLTFLAPCVLPVYPMYISYISGMSVNELKNTNHTQKRFVLMQSIYFVLGLSSVFMLIGFSTSLIGNFMFEYQRLLQIVGGVLLLVMGLQMMNVIQISFLNMEKRMTHQSTSISSVNSFLIGLTFGAGWTPCIGPVLASVYALGAVYPEKMFMFILVFILGFGLPFILLSFFISFLDKLKKHMNTLQIINGILFIIMGILLMSGMLDKLSVDLTKWFGDTWF